MATIPTILLNGTTADANDVMDDFNEIYDNIDSTNIASGNRTGTAGGKIVLQTSATIITPTIQGQITLNTSNSILGNVNLFTGSDINLYSDSGTTLKYTVDGATGSFGMASGSKFFLDGTTLVTDTYFIEKSANVIGCYTGGLEILELDGGSTPKQIIFGSGVNVNLQATQKLFYDGGGDTYITEESANTLAMYCANTSMIQLDGAASPKQINFISGEFSMNTNKFSVATGNYIDFADNGQIVFSVADNMSVIYNDTNNDFKIDFNGTTAATFLSTGSVRFPNHVTTGSAANAHLDSVLGTLARSTSSIKYKENVADLELDSSLIYDLRPVSYDDKTSKKRFFGLIAEEVDQIMPGLVYHREDTGECESVTYDRLSVLLLSELKKLKSKIDELEARA